MSRVFIVQPGSARDQRTGEKRSFDFSAAEDFGELVYLLDEDAQPADIDAILDILHKKLSTITDKDYIVLTGSPVLIAWVGIVAALYCDQLNFLQWYGRAKRYLLIRSPKFERRVALR